MSAHRPITLAPMTSAREPLDHAHQLINAAFCGKLDQRDQVYMARALLQLSDEMAEMKERMRAMEMAMQIMIKGGKH